MKKRAAIARVLAIDPAILMMDEPFAPLDALTRQRLQDEILTTWEATGCTILYVTHDLTEAITLADRVLLMSTRPGKVVREYVIDLPRPRRVMDVKFTPPLCGAGARHLERPGNPIARGGRSMKSRSHAPSPGVWTLMIVLGLLVLWEVAAAGGHVNEFFLQPPLPAVAGVCGHGLQRPAGPSTCPPPDRRPGWASSLAAYWAPWPGWDWGSPRVSRLLMPLMTGLNGLPKLALGPLFIIWFGLGLQSKVLISALMVFFSSSPSTSTPASAAWTLPWWRPSVCWGAAAGRCWGR